MTIPSFVISRTPCRVSFFGGGTDYPSWFESHPGAVLATSINKYVYVSVKWLPKFFENKYYLSYSKLEAPQTISKIDHPSIKSTLEYLNFEKDHLGIDLHYFGDLPAQSGMGSSSAFTVGLINTLIALRGQTIEPIDMAWTAIDIEQNVIHENVGSQDQVTAAVGGFNKIEFGDDWLRVSPINGASLEPYLMLFFTGLTRIASTVAKEQITNLQQNIPILSEMYSLVSEAISHLNQNNLIEFGKLLNYNWSLKKKLSSQISTPKIDTMYATAIKAGALGGKLLGAGHGGFLLFCVEPDKQPIVRKAMEGLLEVPIKFEPEGSKIIYGGNN
jgi:D-glycero-alpha-D-manno-heptose-7-phosphate kinase